MTHHAGQLLIPNEPPQISVANNESASSVEFYDEPLPLGSSPRTDNALFTMLGNNGHHSIVLADDLRDYWSCDLYYKTICLHEILNDNINLPNFIMHELSNISSVGKEIYFGYNRESDSFIAGYEVSHNEFCTAVAYFTIDTQERVIDPVLATRVTMPFFSGYLQELEVLHDGQLVHIWQSVHTSTSPTSAHSVSVQLF